jgi:hypothetical protein
MNNNKTREVFFKLFPYHTNAIRYDDEKDCFIPESGTTPYQLVDLWNLRYRIFKAGCKASETESSEKIKELEFQLSGFKAQYNKDEKAITESREKLDIALKHLKNCHNCDLQDWDYGVSYCKKRMDCSCYMGSKNHWQNKAITKLDEKL